MRNHQRQRHMTSPSLLALATLGGITQIRSFLFLSCCPRRPRQVLKWLSRVAVADGFANKCCQCKLSIKLCLHWKNLVQNCQRQWHATLPSLLALATLGSMTQKGSFLFFVALPKEAKASTEVTVTCHCW